MNPKKEISIPRPHEQYNLPSFLGVKETKNGELKFSVPIPRTNGDFELQSPSILRTNKDFAIKQVFSITDQEISSLNGQRFKRVAVSGSSNTISMSDYLIAVTALAVAPTIGLPHPSIAGNGKTFIVKDEVGGAGTTTITIRSEGERTIDGASSSTLVTNYQAKTFYSDGANYFVI